MQYQIEILSHISKRNMDIPKDLHVKYQIEIPSFFMQFDIKTKHCLKGNTKKLKGLRH